MAGASLYIPYAFRAFQGFSVQDIKEWQSRKEMEIVLGSDTGRSHQCGRCHTELGAQHGRYWLKCRHLRVMGWTVTVGFWREKRYCPECRKVRSEKIDFICPTSPHMTMELAWWINRLTEITSVYQASQLEGVDKMTCYKVDKLILTNLLQGYRIPKVTHLGVDEVYARGPRQLKPGENRDDLFMTVIVDLKTRKVLWVSQSRKQKALDEFFELLGPEACAEIEVVATDQHPGYGASVEMYCPNAIVVWDRFHLVKNFNEALNEERKIEQENVDPEGAMENLISGRYKYLFLTKARNRTERDKRHIDEVMRLNSRLAKLELIKEHFHKVFDSNDPIEAQVIISECYEWSYQARAQHLVEFFFNLLDKERFYNFFKCKATTGVVEGINRVIKGLKWQAYGYKDMFYFGLKILQKVGYLNHHFLLATHK